MLKKLRIKFITLIMIVVALVLGVSFTTICMIDYQTNLSQVYSTLDAAISQASDRAKQGNNLLGKLAEDFPGNNATNNIGSSGSSNNNTADENSTKQSEDGASNNAGTNGGKQSYTPPEIGGFSSKQSNFTPAAVYIEGEDGTLTAVENGATASIADDVLSQAGEKLASAKAGKGTLSSLGLIYAKRSVGDTTYIAFADTNSVSGWQSLAATLTLVGLAALVVFFFVSVFFSQWALKPVQDAWSKQKQFVADASHDLKTPLTVILANTSILMEHPEHTIASESQWLESTQHEALGMQELVGDLLTMAQLDEEAAGGMGATAGALPAAKETIDFTDLVEGELLQFESVAFEGSIELKDNLEQGICVAGNRQRLRRLAVTLIDNACKYAGLGGTVSIMLSSQGKQAVLSVNNTGTVISEEDLPHIFDRFYRADKARTNNAEASSDTPHVGGHGLGLAIAHAIAEEHGGTLTATSNAADGTTFTAKLPLA